MNKKPDHTDRFKQLWKRCLLPGKKNQGDLIYIRLISAYEDPVRYYHSLTHIHHCLSMFDEVRSLLQSPEAVELAIWYHDSIYYPDGKNNEQKSADYFLSQAENLLPADLCDRVCRHILATVHDNPDLDDADSRHIVDIDLSSLGLNWTHFKQDSDNIRREMIDVPEAKFYRNQGQFLQALLDRKRLFQSDYFFKAYEQKARQNLTEYLGSIKQ